MKNAYEIIDDLFYGTYDKVGFQCGCGDPAQVDTFIYKLLTEQDSINNSPPSEFEGIRQKQMKLIADNPAVALEFILKVLDGHKFLEHGSMIHNAKLTENSKVFLEAFKLRSTQNIIETMRKCGCKGPLVTSVGVFHDDGSVTKG